MTSDYLTLLAQHFDVVLDPLAILMTYLFTQRIKAIVNEHYSSWRPVIAIAVGFTVAIAYASVGGGFPQVPFYGMVYGAGAIVLYEIGFPDILRKVGDLIKGKIK